MGTQAELGPTFPVPAPHVERLFDVPTAACEILGRADERALAPAEAALVAGASPRRRSEFAAGRACAQAALARAGLAAGPLLVGVGRAPAWPQGVRGSITHTDRYALAVVTSSPAGRRVGIGVDAERVGRVTPDVHHLVFTPPEQVWLAGMERAQRAALATVAFAAKEAFYKAQHPVTGAWVGFLDVVLRPVGTGLVLAPATSGSVPVATPADGTPPAVSPPLAGWRWPVPVRWVVADERAIVGVTLHRRERLSRPPSSPVPGPPAVPPRRPGPSWT